MLTIFNRKELITTMDMQRQANIRSVLSANGIAYTVRTENLQGSSAFGGRSRGRSGSFGVDPNYWSRQDLCAKLFAGSAE